MDVRMTNIYVLFYFIVYNVIQISGRYCYSRYYYYYRYGYYYYCNSYSSVGTIAGAVIGGIIGLVIIIAIVVVVCASCCKSHGSRGTVVQPYPTTSTVHTVTTIPAYNHRKYITAKSWYSSLAIPNMILSSTVHTVTTIPAYHHRKYITGKS
ncbi:Hypothetical predicted protein [Mytilus galloprovincialis]|uniref:Uncharacterized protein n=1 Tax=Mytilus galloprovincialis TaxID=29158 RepID=A0A8B6CXI8_MYTGA|nr:Hypothetical predicted protein [Mytilus galloprovincialis]